MTILIKKIKHSDIKQVLFYLLIGLVALFVQTMTYLLLCKINIGAIYSNFFGNVFGFIVGYLGHTKYTFAKAYRFSHKEFMKYLITALIGLGFTSTCIFILIHTLNYSKETGLIPMMIAPIITFLISKFWAFK